MPEIDPSMPVSDPAPAVPSLSPLPDAAPPSPDSATPVSFDLLSFAQEQGLELGDISDPADLAGRLFDELRQAKTIAKWAQENVRQQPEPEPEPAPPAGDEWTEDKYFSQRWDVPSYDQQWEAMVQQGAIVRNAEGKWVPTPGNEWLAANPALGQLNQWETKRSAKLREYMDGNLPRRLYDDLREPFDRRYVTREQIEEMLGARATEEYVANLEDSLAPHLYRDLKNVPEHGSAAFQQNLTEYGRKLFQVVDDLMELNPSAPQHVIIEKALRYAPVPQAAAVPTAPATPAAPSIPPVPAAVAASPPSSFIDDAMQRAAHNPSGVTPAGSHVDPKRLSAQDVRTMFVRAAETAGA